MVWGKIITWLRTEKQITPYLACSEIKQVKIDDSTLVACTDKMSLIGTLQEKEIKNKIESLLKKFGLKFGIEYVKSREKLLEEDIARLKEFADEYLTIK